jgi:Zn-dependent peptidase ImmA (M78 family)
LGAFDFDRGFWTQLLGCSDRQLNDWSAGRREVPFSIAERLSRAIGVPVEMLRRRGKEPIDIDMLLPPLWLKARESSLDSAGHQAIAIARLLAARYEEILSLVEPTGNPRLFVNEIKEVMDPQHPARTQGEHAANAFLRLTTLGRGASGIGEVIRGFLRARGMLIIETPINSTRLEGFCVPVGAEHGPRPCVVVNSYRTTWFRRNYIILHELAHAIFDLDAASAVFDVPSASREEPTNIAEQRADAFAQHALVPRRLLVAQSRGKPLKDINAEGMAELIAAIHAEQRLIVKAALEYGLISQSDSERLANLKVARELRAKSWHARGLADLAREDFVFPEVADWGPRLTTFPLKDVRLPIPFIRLVVQAAAEGKISSRKAAELLMVTDEDLPRYGIEPRREEEEALAS